MKLSRLIAAAFGMLILLTASGCVRETTVIFVRHAEKGAGRDPSLTPEGRERAEALVDAVGRAGVSVIYVTNFQRTQQTAGPTAAEVGVTPIVMEISGSAQAHAAAIAADIRESRTGQRVLVVGHSNTVTLVMEELGVTGVRPIDEEEFDRMFVVTLRKNAAPRLIEGKYGE